jgi:hypothetical protein
MRGILNPLAAACEAPLRFRPDRRPGRGSALRIFVPFRKIIIDPVFYLCETVQKLSEQEARMDPCFSPLARSRAACAAPRRPPKPAPALLAALVLGAAALGLCPWDDRGQGWHLATFTGNPPFSEQGIPCPIDDR